jgi:hypothetical protein
MRAGVNRDLVFAEKVTGTKRDGCEKLDLLLKIADAGDRLMTQSEHERRCVGTSANPKLLT